MAGLLGGNDLKRALEGKKMDRLLITSSMLKADEDIFLDDVTVTQLEDILQTKIIANDNDGGAFLTCLIDGEEEEFAPEGFTFVEEI